MVAGVDYEDIQIAYLLASLLTGDASDTSDALLRAHLPAGRPHD
ncbi:MULTISPECIES: hypothetical protein [unclassified Streptomyces]|nr:MULTISPECIES: hypothetical protein [unclassified Streptomyces]WSA91021.1 hypothetical protein OIE63_05300 [Streptomyces sp. NBC_01795]WSB75345.1 hypothetical protein OHB04_05840 [Streptomyces sp. NBC_01775]WSS16372.1 hypothetical protein OG533_34070 [Streptomyces sp. NBC_01186]WSS45190.1 hypothetical protein OG220_34745 [Streptomyces sp. NBC_01187]